MEKIERKTFLKVATFATAAVGFLYPGLTTLADSGRRLNVRNAQTTKVDALALDEITRQFAQGEVVSRTTDGVVLQTPDTVRAVRIAPGTVVWKEFNTTPDEIQLGDWLDVKGTPLADGSLQAASGWIFVNIARRDGYVAAVSPTGLTITDEHGRSSETLEISTRLDPRQHVVSVKDGSPLPNGLASLAPGAPVGAVGIQLANGRFRATRIWS